MLGYSLQIGQDALRAYLSRSTIDFKAVDVPAFRRWLRKQLERKERDAVFQKRCEIRDVWREHAGVLHALKATLERTKEAFRSSPHHQRLGIIKGELNGAHRAVEGLSKALESSAGEKREALAAKRQSFVEQIEALEAEEEQLRAESPERDAYEEAKTALHRYESEIGITALEEELQALFKSQGRRSQRAGVRFEDVCKAYAREEMLPRLEARGDTIDRERVHILSGVTLGAAQTELDNLIVLRNDDPDAPVEVLALVEAKRNPNDVASGFLMRQKNLGFFCGNEDMYNPDDFVTKTYPKGRFVGTAIHEEEGESFCFAPESFPRFTVTPEVGYYLDRLFFVVMRRPLQGLDSGEYSRLMYRISTDIHFDLDDDAYLHALLVWTQSFVKLLQTSDILEIYAQREDWAEQFFLLVRE